jgi:quercetin dioxygenase-like cupin family protein
VRVRARTAVAAIGLVGAGAIAGTVIAQTSEQPVVKRDALAASDQVRGAPDRSLSLSRVVVPSGAKLALHHHLGTQVAFIQSGVLTYTVEDGSVRVMSGSPDENPTFVRQIGAGDTGKIRAGEWIVEQPSVIHRAANSGNAKVKIYLATLLRTGAPPSTPVD